MDVDALSGGVVEDRCGRSEQALRQDRGGIVDRDRIAGVADRVMAEEGLRVAVLSPTSAPTKATWRPYRAEAEANSPNSALQGPHQDPQRFTTTG